MKRLLAVLLLLPGCAASSESKIQTVLGEQVEAWNRGDIEGFMEGYWKSEEMVFRSNGKENRGWTATLNRYKKSYDTRAKMGTLSFSELATRMLSDSEAEVTGRFHLKRDKDNPTGKFKLLFRRFPFGWRIVVDETLSE